MSSSSDENEADGLFEGATFATVEEAKQALKPVWRFVANMEAV